MKIGVIIQYFDKRSDVRRLIAALSKSHDVVIFCKQREAGMVDAHEVRVMLAYRRSARNRIWNLLYALFGNLPASLGRYYEWRQRLYASDRSSAGLGMKMLLELSTRLPTLIDFDRYLRHLQFDDETRVDDIDVFFSFTDVNDVYFLAQLSAASKPVVTYLYSWDHPGKYHKFSKSWILYLTWNGSLKQDLVDLHGIDPDNISVVGSSQLCYVEEFLRVHAGKLESPFPFDYVYFGAAVGYKKVTVQEVRLIGKVAEVLERVAPSVKLVVRPYPIGGVFDYYKDLRELPNVVIHDYREPETEMLFSEDGIVKKLNAIFHARAFVHIGSTLGLEASYFDTPVLHLDIGDVDLGVDPDSSSSIHRVIHAMHAERYLILPEYDNVVKTSRDLVTVLDGVLREPEKYLAYNRQLSGETELRNFDDLSEAIIGRLRVACAKREQGDRVASRKEVRRGDKVHAGVRLSA